MIALALALLAASPGPSESHQTLAEPYTHARELVDAMIKPWDPGPYAQPTADIEFKHIFDHAKDRPPLALRILDSRPGAYRSKWGPPPTLLLGDMLFHAPKLLGPRTAIFGLSCDSCHPNGGTTRDLFFPGESDRPGNIDLLFPARIDSADDGIYAPRNVPSLRGLRYLGPYLHDGSKGSISEVVDGVVGFEFGQAMPHEWLSALTLYVTQLDFLPNPQIDDLGRLTSKAGEPAHRGEQLFRAPRPQFDGASCATCHVPSAFFTDHLPHRMRHGEGKGTTTPGEAFVTPTLINIDESGPYFFDGSAKTLGDAVELIEKRHQLGLSKSERADLTAYLDAVGAAEGKRYVPTLATQLETYLVYLDLLLDGPYKDDPKVWTLTLDTVRHGMRDQLEGSPAGPERRRLEPLVKRFEQLITGEAKSPTDDARAALQKLRTELLDAVHVQPFIDPATARREREAAIQKQK